MGYPSDSDFEEAARGPSGPDYYWAFGNLQKEAHQTAKDKGFWDVDSGDYVAIGNMHAELSEAWESLRHGNPPSDHIPEFSGVEEEFADVLIRIFDTCEKRGYRLAEAVIAKMRFNRSRSYKHGGKDV